MVGKQQREQEDLFIAGPLRDLIPDDHILKQVDKVLDLSWLEEEVRDCYCPDKGRPSIDPESALRLMLAGFFHNIIHDRALMREAQVNLAIRWFAGYRLDEALPERSSLTRIRQRWGEPLFRRVFERTVAQCVAAGLVNAETVHVDATLIRADVSWDSLMVRHADRVLEANPGEEEDGPGKSDPPDAKPAKPKKYSPTDPEATMATSCKQYHLEPTYKRHTVVEDQSGVIVDVAVTTGEAPEADQLLGQLDRVEQMTGTKVKAATGDAAYANGRNYAALEERATDAVIPPQKASIRKKVVQRIPARRFKYDARNDQVTCPCGKRLHRAGRGKNGYWYRAASRDCQACPVRARCISPTSRARGMLIVDGYTALLRARRRKETGWDPATRDKYQRHRWRVEGVHGRAKTQHGLRRAIRRGLAGVRGQVYLTAAAMNLKKLAATLADLLKAALFQPWRFLRPLNLTPASFQRPHTLTAIRRQASCMPR